METEHAPEGGRPGARGADAGDAPEAHRGSGRVRPGALGSSVDDERRATLSEDGIP